jgi:hypothetical protein
LSDEPVSSSVVPSVSFCASQGWLNQVAEAAAAKGPAGVGEHLDRDRRLLLGLEAGDGNDLPVAVAMRKPDQQIADGGDPGVGGGLGQPRANPLQLLQGDVEGARSRQVDRRLTQLGGGELCAAGEAARHYCAASSHHQLG